MNRHDDDIRIMEKVKQIISSKLPGYASRYFNDNWDKKVPRTLYGYALDLKAFFEYLESISKPISKMTLEDLNSVTVQIIENYMEHIRTYAQNGSRKETSVAGLHRKYASLSAFFNYYYKLGLIDSNPVHRVAAPKPARHITQGPTNEINLEMLDFVANGNLNGHAAAFQEHTKERDLAIIMLIMGAGIKVSDLVNLDINDVHLEDNSITVRNHKDCRTIFVSSTIACAVGRYLAKRLEIVVQYGDDLALFLSLQCKRICVRTVQKMIKKYSSAMFDGKHHLTGEALALSFRNNVFEQTKNIGITSKATGNDSFTVLDRYRSLIEQYENTKSHNFLYDKVKNQAE